MSPAELSGKRALVTGSSGGLGLAMASALARAGCDVMLHGIEANESVSPVADQLSRESGRRVAYSCVDVSTAAGVTELIDSTTALFGTIDILINNAVVRHFAPIDAFPVAEWDRALAVNVTAAFLAVRAVLGGMRERRWGRIVNMASVYGSRATTNRVDYVTTKHALIGLTRAIALESIGHGVTCNAVCPASVRTPSIDSRMAQLIETGLSEDEAERQFLAGKQPTGTFVEADDVAALVMFLLSPAGKDITGAVLPVDGGWQAS